MTVSSTTSRNEYNGNAATTDFAYTFRILDEDHVSVYVDDVLQTITTDYTVSDVGVSGGGTISFVAAPAAGTANVIFLRNVPLTQETDYVENDPFPAESHEDALDKLTMVAQQLQEQIDRTIVLPPTSTVTDLTLPVPAAGKALLWNATEDGLENSTDNFNTIVTAAAASASAASASASAASGSASAASTSATNAANSAIAAAASAAAIPTFASLTGEGLNFARVAAGETSIEFRTPAEVLSDIGAQAADADIATVAASQGEMEAGTEAALRSMSPLRVAQAIAALASGGGMPLAYLAGLTLSNNVSDANNDIDIAAGSCRDSTNAEDMVLASALTKQLDAAWVVGTNQGGLDTGAEANSTWYHVWLIKRSDTDVVDALFSTSATAPTMPANYDFKRRIGAVRNDGSGNILGFYQNGDTFMYKSPVQDVSSTTSASAATLTVTAPLGVVTEGIFSGTIDGAGGGSMVYFSPTAATDVAPSYTNGIFSFASPGAGNYGGCEFRCICDTSSQVRWRSDDASRPVYISIKGYVDLRGKG